MPATHIVDNLTSTPRVSGATLESMLGKTKKKLATEAGAGPYLEYFSVK
jgi:hypothetical protein